MVTVAEKEPLFLMPAKLMEETVVAQEKKILFWEQQQLGQELVME
jgi:hypothetical protein